MKIVIVGAGKVGEILCKDLSAEGHDIKLIEENSKILEKIISSNDILGIVGNGTKFDILSEAGTENADLFISVTEKDEINIISCVIAKKMGAQYTIARVRNTEYSSQMDLMSSALGIDKIINPELEAAKYIHKNIYFKNSLNIETFFNGKLKLVEFIIEEGSYLEGMSLFEFKQNYFKNLLVCIIKRNDEIIIPQGDFILNASDMIYVSGEQKDLFSLYRSLGKSNRSIKSVFIIGAGRIAHYLTSYLMEDNIDIKVVDISEEVARIYNDSFPNVTTINGDGSDEDLLSEEGFKDYDACISLTGIDEMNILISMFAKKIGISKIITKINKPYFLDVLGKNQLTTVVTPKKLIADKIVKIVRTKNTNKNNILNLYRLENNRVEAIEFLIDNDCKILGTLIKDLPIKKNVILSYIIRNNEIIIPSGRDFIKVEDRVIVITTETHLYDINEILL